jgi:hypothetical protein
LDVLAVEGAMGGGTAPRVQLVLHLPVLERGVEQACGDDVGGCLRSTRELRAMPTWEEGELGAGMGGNGAPVIILHLPARWA